MKQQFSLNVSPREGTGRSASRRLRKQDRVPAILYGKHTAPITLSLDGPEFTRLVKAIGVNAALIELKGTGDKPLSILQEVQRDPMTDRYLHVDLHEVKADEKMEINVPVHMSGESTGVKNEAGILDVATHRLRIRCLPKDLPAFIEVDVTELKVGESIHVGELKPIPGVEYLDDKSQAVSKKAVGAVAPILRRGLERLCRERLLQKHAHLWGALTAIRRRALALLDSDSDALRTQAAPRPASCSGAGTFPVSCLGLR